MQGSTHKSFAVRSLGNGWLTQSIGGANLALRFAVELGAYASLAYWGASVGTSSLSRTALAVLFPLTAMGLWSTYLAPRARRRLRDPGALSAELAIFAASGVALASSRHFALCVALIVVGSANALLLRVLRQRAHPEARA